MNKIITAPQTINDSNNKSIFLAGGITNCPDWQKYVSTILVEQLPNGFDIINPRRISWDDTRNNDEVSKEQIIWEKNYINKSDYILFWFPKETLCPITLFELGSALYTKNIACIGIDPEYQRKLDIEVQTSLVNKNIPIEYSLDNMITTVINYIKK